MHAAAVRRASWSHPEAGAAAAAAAAWLALLLAVAGPEPVRAAHAAAHRDLPLVAGAIGWITMTVAMMVPAALPIARDHALGALWARRQRTVGLFFAGYVAVWALFGAAAALVAAVAERDLGVPRSVVLAATLLTAGVWELSAAKWRAVRACHLVAPLPPRGLKADIACLRAGAVYGRRCVMGCWPVMLAMAVAGHGVIGLMVLLAGFVAAEKLLARPAQFAGAIAAALVGAAVVAIVS